MKQAKWKKLFIFALFVMIMVVPTVCGASQTSTYGSASNQPWNTGLNTIEDWVTGPIPISVGAISLAGFLIMMAMGNGGHFTSKLLGIVMCISAAIKAGTLMGYLDVSGVLFK